jgi:hypothetical protein
MTKRVQQLLNMIPRIDNEDSPNAGKPRHRLFERFVMILKAHTYSDKELDLIEKDLKGTIELCKAGELK